MTSQIVLTDEPSGVSTPGSGKMSVHTINKKLYIKDDAGVLTLLGGKDPETKSIIIENPSTSEDISFLFTDVPITISKIVVVLVGSSTPSVTWTVRHGTSRSAGGSEVVIGGTTTTDTGIGDTVTIFDDPSIVADAHVWIETTAKSGTVSSMIINIFYNED